MLTAGSWSESQMLRSWQEDGSGRLDGTGKTALLGGRQGLASEDQGG